MLPEPKVPQGGVWGWPRAWRSREGAAGWTLRMDLAGAVQGVAGGTFPESVSLAGWPGTAVAFPQVLGSSSFSVFWSLMSCSAVRLNDWRALKEESLRGVSWLDISREAGHG